MSDKWKKIGSLADLTPICPYCGSASVLASSKEVYRRDYGPIYICRPCNAYVGCHKGTTKPLGRLANAELRSAKILAHDRFDSLWGIVAIEQGLDEDDMSYAAKGLRHKIRTVAYQELAKLLEIPKDDCHIGMMDVATCQRVVDICNKVEPLMGKITENLELL